MPAERRPGLDHGHYEWSPISARAQRQLPGGARLAVSVLVVLEYLEWRPPEGAITNRRLPGGFGPLPFPDYVKHTHREYGHRVGVFRLLDLLERRGIPPTVAIDALTIERYPWLARHVHERGCELVGHGISLSRMISSRMSEAEEQAYIAESLDAVAGVTGGRPEGWFGIEYNESERTPALLAEAGVRYVCDWVNDEQPYPMHVPNGELWSVPLLLTADDAHAMGTRRVPIDRYCRLLVESAEVMADDGGRHLFIALRPWLSGQPFRARELDRALAAIMAIDGVIAIRPAELL
ncbi:MAG: polysaccharide deacetylase family protein [Acidimicrobiia bacterium]|nr:polysaccharide deacetylase family protein [Acidimicrobiia bacterium]